MKNRPALSLLAACLPLTALAQATSYLDAENAGEAVGMMQTTQLAARIMREQCGNRFPELAVEIDANLAKWHAREEAAIRKSNFHWARMVKLDASLLRDLPILEAAIRKSVAAKSQVPGEAGNQAFLEMCRQHFSALASGVWRERTPKAYKFLDEAP